jgi:hypothetical protein
MINSLCGEISTEAASNGPQARSAKQGRANSARSPLLGAAGLQGIETIS